MHGGRVGQREHDLRTHAQATLREQIQHGRQPAGDLRAVGPGEPDPELGRTRVGQRDHPILAGGQIHDVGQDTGARRVDHGVDRRCVGADLGREVRAEQHRNGAEGRQ